MIPCCATTPPSFLPSSNRQAERAAREAEEAEIARKREEAKLRSYETLFKDAEPQTSNREQTKDFKAAEEDFM